MIIRNIEISSILQKKILHNSSASFIQINPQVLWVDTFFMINIMNIRFLTQLFKVTVYILGFCWCLFFFMKAFEIGTSQVSRQDSGSSGAKNVLDNLENYTKVNLQKNISGKAFQNKWGAMAVLLCPRACITRGQLDDVLTPKIDFSMVSGVLFEGISLIPI